MGNHKCFQLYYWERSEGGWYSDGQKFGLSTDEKEKPKKKIKIRKIEGLEIIELDGVLAGQAVDHWVYHVKEN